MTEWASIGQNICLSGGAEGADLQWGMNAGRAGHQVFHFIFPQHRSRAPESEKVVLTDEQLAVAEPYLAKANLSLGRKWPVRNPFVRDLLRRNFYQVIEAEALYAVATIEDNGLVSGGTSWAVQMFLDRFPDSDPAAYVYDQVAEHWYGRAEQGWSPIDQPPVPTGVYAGIGSRDLKDAGKMAIRHLYGALTTT